MSHPSKTSLEVADRGEFMRLSPALIKLESGAFWREEVPHDLEALKASIIWREKRMQGSGLLVPLLVSKIDGIEYYQLEDGFRRFKAVTALIAEGVPIVTVPVRVLSAPLSMSERLMLMTHGTKPLGILEEAKIIARLEKQGLTLESMARLMNRSLETLKKRAILGKLTGTLVEAMLEKKINPEEVEFLIQPNEPAEEQQVHLEKEFKKILKGTTGPTAKPEKKAKELLGELLGQKNHTHADTEWMPKVLDPTLHYVALEGLYEWIGGENAVRQGYSKKVIEIVKLMLKYCGGKMNLLEIAEKLKKY